MHRRAALGFGLAAAASPIGAEASGTRSLHEIRLSSLRRFADLFYVQKKVREAFELLVAETYIQHSPGIGQGREAAIRFLEPMFARPQFRTTPVRILLDGDFASILIRAQINEAVEAMVVDIFRFEGDRIVEHWDVKGEIPVSDRPGYFDGFAKGG